MSQNLGNGDLDARRTDQEQNNDSGGAITRTGSTGSGIDAGEWKGDEAEGNRTGNPENGNTGSGSTGRGRIREGLW